MIIKTKCWIALLLVLVLVLGLRSTAVIIGESKPHALTTASVQPHISTDYVNHNDKWSCMVQFNIFHVLLEE